ncbi:MAG: hypothetical protein AABZ53_01315 [Planctomycetota bacterium]
MNEIERRTLLGAVGVGAFAAIAKAGPLNPPAGPITSTGRTTDEIFNKIPAGGAGDGRTAIAGGVSAISITQPGSYVLTGNVTTSGSCLSISASHVTLDLNGFTLTSTSTSSIAASINGNRVVVRNGAVVGGSFCINVSSNLVGTILEDVDVLNAQRVGVSVSGGNVGCVIRRCRIIDTGSTTVAADALTLIAGINCLASTGTRVEDCMVVRLAYNGTGTPSFRGITNGGIASSTERCVVYDDFLNAGTGITATNGVYRDNTVVNFTTAYSGGTNAGGNV